MQGRPGGSKRTHTHTAQAVSAFRYPSEDVNDGTDHPTETAPPRGQHEPFTSDQTKGSSHLVGFKFFLGPKT